MLSFDPEKPFAGLNIGTGNAFDAQSQQAQQALALTDDQYKLISQLQNPQNSLAYQRQAAAAAGNVPQLRFGGETFAEGLGNGINNYFGMRGYQQQQQGYKDIMQQQQAYQQQQANDYRTQLMAQQTRRQKGGQKLPTSLRDIYSALDPSAQDKLLSDTAGKQLDSSSIIQASQDKLNWQRERFKALTGTYPEQVFAMGNQGALTPQMQSAWKYVYEADPPKDALDFQKRYSETANTVEGAKSAVIDNQTRGQRNQANLDGSLLENSYKQVNLKYAEALKQADLLVAQGKAEEASKLKENLDGGMARFNQAMQQYEQMTPGQISLFNAQMKAIGLPYELPAKQELKAVTNKGKVTQFYDPYTGQVKVPGK